MYTRSTIVICLLVTTCGVCIAANASETLDPIPGVGINRGITRVVCQWDESEGWLRSRAIIIDVGESEPLREVLLAPSHGLPADPEAISRDCVVAGQRGSTLQITDLWLSRDRNESLVGDWAILVTDRAIEGDIPRLEIRSLVDVSGAERDVDEIQVRLLLHSQSVDQNCRISFESSGVSAAQGSELFLHSCRTWRGISGAPIVVGVDGKPVVIGYHIVALQGPVRALGEDINSIGRAIDSGIEAAVTRAAERARSPDEHRSYLRSKP